MPSTKEKHPTLTPKQERFAQLYIELGNASEAYRQSYDASRMKQETIWRKAKELLDNGKVTARIETLQAAAQKRHEVTVDNLTYELEAARALAFKTKQPAAAVAAIMGKAKLHGLLTEKHEHAGTDGKPLKIEVVYVRPGKGK